MAMAIPDALAPLVGQTRYSNWLLVDQRMIDRFADATGDRQFIHVDPERAARTPFGGTVAHGFLTLALLPALLEMSGEAAVPDARMGVNYGLDRVRFVAPVPAGSRIRAAFTLVSAIEKRPGRLEEVRDVTVEIEGADRPALVARWILQFFV